MARIPFHARKSAKGSVMNDPIALNRPEPPPSIDEIASALRLDEHTAKALQEIPQLVVALDSPPLHKVRKLAKGESVAYSKRPPGLAEVQSAITKNPAILEISRYLYWCQQASAGNLPPVSLQRDTVVAPDFGSGYQTVHTYLTAINDTAETVGYVIDHRGYEHGFFRDPAGNFTFLDNDPFAACRPLGINNAGKVVGATSGGTTEAFLYDIPSRQFETLGFGGDGSGAFDINENNLVLGLVPNQEAFVWDLGKQTKVQGLNDPTSLQTLPLGINNDKAMGMIVGQIYRDATATDAGGWMGFRYSGLEGYHDYRIGNSDRSACTGISNGWAMVGWCETDYSSGTSAYRFLWRCGAYQEFRLDPYLNCWFQGINNKGQIVGYCQYPHTNPSDPTSPCSPALGMIATIA
jgi:hypothetical protein